MNFRKGVRTLLLCCVLAGLLAVEAVPLPVRAIEAGEDASASKKLVALTFDDGPSALTPELLDGLQSRGAYATFFLCGDNGTEGIVNHPELLQRMIEEGHQLADHSWDHPAFLKLTGAQVASEFGQVEPLLYEAMGGSYEYMVRTPNGSYSNTIRDNAPAPVILWDADTLDWKYHDVSYICNRIRTGVKDGSIVLMHDVLPTTIEAALKMVDELQEKGYECVTVAELMRRRGVTLRRGIAYRSAPDAGSTLSAYQAPDVKIVRDDAARRVQVECAAAEDGVTLYYTLDGTYPTLASARYEEPLLIQEDATLRVVGYDRFASRTPETTQPVERYKVKKPRVALRDGQVELHTDTPKATLYYTLDGSDPLDEETREKYTKPISLKGVSALKVVGLLDGGFESDVVTAAVTKSGEVFFDVDPDAWYFAGVDNLVSDGLLQGTARQTFSPDEPLNRGTLAALLYAMAGRPEKDGASSSTAAPAVFQLLYRGDGPRQSGEAAERDEAAESGEIAERDEAAESGKVAERDESAESGEVDKRDESDENSKAADSAAPEDERPENADAFSDVAADAWYADAVQWASEAGLVRGYSDARFAPQDPVTREQLATVLYRFARQHKQMRVQGEADLDALQDGDAVSAFAARAVSWALESGLLEGDEGRCLHPDAAASRAETAALVDRFQTLDWKAVEPMRIADMLDDMTEQLTEQLKETNNSGEIE